MPKPIRINLVIKTVKDQIANQTLTTGDRLPSIRRMAEAIKVSNTTVAEAYDRLVADGTLHAKLGSGYYVLPSSKPLKLAKVPPNLDYAIDPFWVSRQSLDTRTTKLMPGCGWLPSSWMPLDEIRQAMRKMARSEYEILSDYGDTKGSQRLRQWLARQATDEGLPIDPEQILLTPSGTQAIDLICRLLLKPGDYVLVDDPCYFNFRALLKAHQVNIIGVPFEKDGPNLDAFRGIVSEYKPRLYVTNSVFHNPTGITVSHQKAHKLIAAAHNMVIVEDDIFSGFEITSCARMAVMDGLEKVIRIGSFSKTLSASVRCGYIAAKPDWIEALVDLQVATNFGGPSPLASELIFLTLNNGTYRKHMSKLLRRLEKKRAEVSEALLSLGIHIPSLPNGGLYLWCELPNKMDSSKLAKAALEEDLVLAPGNVFSPSMSKDSFMRFNVSQTNKKAIAILKRLMDQTH